MVRYETLKQAGMKGIDDLRECVSEFRPSRFLTLRKPSGSLASIYEALSQVVYCRSICAQLCRLDAEC